MRFFPSKKREEPDMVVRRNNNHPTRASATGNERARKANMRIDPMVNNDRYRYNTKIFNNNNNNSSSNKKIPSNHMITVQQEVENSSNKQSVAGLVNKLNCAASKKDFHRYGDDYEQYLVTTKNDFNSKNNKSPSSSPPSMHMLKQQQRTASSWTVSNPLVRKCKPQSDITRPVLITVKDGDLSDSNDNEVVPPNNNRKGPFRRTPTSSPPRELKTSFIVGELPTAKVSTLSSLMFGSAVRKNHQQHYPSGNFSGLTRTPSSSPKRTTNHNQSKRQHNRNQYSSSESDVGTTKATSYPLTEKELARRERWRKGLEMEQRMWKNNNSDHEAGDGTDYSSMYNSNNNDDANTQTSCTTGGTSYNTGDSSTADDSTDATETDDSGDDPSRHRGGTSRSNNNNNRRSSTTRGGGGGGATSVRPSSRAVQTSGHCSSREQILNEIKEDLGIVASLLWADGVACIGGAAAITKETVAGCKDGEL
jgi:hypothetical protein